MTFREMFGHLSGPVAISIGGYIEFHYPAVFEYHLVAGTLGQGHGDWRYDEFRLDEKGRLVHEIEWAAYGATNTWRIVASDVHHRWVSIR